MICAIAPNPTDLLGLVDTLYQLKRDIKDVSLEQLKVSVRHLHRWQERPVPIQLLSHELIGGLLLHLRDERGLSPRSLNGHRRNLITLWKFAVEQKLHDTKPDANEIIRFREPELNPKAWHQDQLALLTAACRNWKTKRPIPGWDGRHFLAIALVIYYTAFRLSACLALRRSQLRPDGSIIADADAQKTNADEVGWLGEDAMAAIAALPNVGDLIFPWPTRKDAFWRRWKALLKSCGLPATRKDGPQKMRRTSASWMEREQPGSAMQHLGHKTPGLAKKSYLDKTIVTGTKASSVLPRISLDQQP